MGKSQKVKCPVSSVILPVKLYYPGLFRMQRQSIFTQAFLKYFQHPICICFICKTHYKIIRISDHTALTLQQWPDLVCKPIVQYVMQINVAQQRRSDSTLWITLFMITHLVSFQYSRFKPLIYLLSYHSILYPQIQKFPQTLMIYTPKVVLDIGVYYVTTSFKTYSVKQFIQCIMR